MSALSMPRVLPGFFLGVLLFSSCGLKSREVFNASNAETVSIGVAYDFAPVDGQSHFSWVLDLAVADINAAGGVMGKSLNLILRDDKNDAMKAMQIAETFHSAGITAVVGHWSSDICYYVEDIYEERGMVLVAPDANSRIIYERDYWNIFRIAPDDTLYARTMAQYAHERGFRSLAVYYAETIYGSSMALALERELARQGIVVADRITGISSVSVAETIRRWRAFGCDGVIIAAGIAETKAPVQALQQAGSLFPVFLTSSFQRQTFNNLVGDHTENVYVFRYDNNFLASRFAERYREAWEEDPTIYEISGYAAVRLLADAITACQTLEGNVLAAWLRNIHQYPSTAGVISYNMQTHEFDGQVLRVEAWE
jgi:branched-chain amino acid transport system substrate-binding protein